MVYSIVVIVITIATVIVADQEKDFLIENVIGRAPNLTDLVRVFFIGR